MIDLDRLDPDWDLAAQHGQASKTGKVSSTKRPGSTAICQCCLNIVYKDPAPLCENSKQLEFLGFGFPLFYVFLKNCIILLLLSICSYNSLSLYWGFHNNYAWCNTTTDHHRRVLAGTSTPQCQTFMVEMSRVQAQVAMDQQILRIMSFVLHLCFLIYLRDKLIKLESYYDERTTSLSDYAVIMKNIPPQIKLMEKIKKFFQSEFEETHAIQKVILFPEYEELLELRDEKKKMINKLRPYYEKDNEDDPEAKGIKYDLSKINQQIIEKSKQMQSQTKNDNIECEKAVIIFNTDEEKTNILEQFGKLDIGKRGPYFGVGSEYITLKEAPEPKEIIWENMNMKGKNKVFNYILGWFLSILLLAVVTVIFYFIMEQKALNLITAIEHIEHHPDDVQYQEDLRGAIALVYIMLILIVLFNKLLMVVLFHIFTDLEKHDTSSKFQFSFGLKYCLGLFFTTALMTLAVEAIRFNNYYSHLYGVIEEETVMFFLNALFVPLFWLVNPYHILKYIRRNINYGKKSVTQREAHTYMEDSEYDIGKRYAEIIETMWFTYLYASIIPIGACISIFGLILYYWIDKYNLLRRSTLSIEVQGQLVKSTMKLLDVTLIMKPIGQIMFDMQIREEYTVGSIVMIILAFIYLLIPMSQVIEYLYPEKFHLEEKTYEEVRNKFKDTYLNSQPFYRVANPMAMSKKIEGKGLRFESKQSLMTESRNLEIDLKLDKTVSEMI